MPLTARYRVGFVNGRQLKHAEKHYASCSYNEKPVRCCRSCRGTRAKGLTNVISQWSFKEWKLGKHYGVLRSDGTVIGVQLY
jgi:hypothetical protein